MGKFNIIPAKTPAEILREGRAEGDEEWSEFDYALQAGIEALSKLEEVYDFLRYLKVRGGLGFDIHDRINALLPKVRP